ncbi:MAG: molybdopterin molybdotransferase MoeA [Candidatus Schekmanbacteria bacterium]|nr:molybdopterin molybdotransferase MoeA [Candidatus Schekmanbacteria bacterium]
MISFETAQAAILAEAKQQAGTEKVDLLFALDRILAEDIISNINIPPDDCSAMDGYAVLSEDLAGAQPDMPVTLRLTGEVAAGQKAQQKLWSGETIQIMTGAPLPQGTEVVVPIEDTRADGDRISFLKYLPEGTNIRRSGEDIKKADLVLKSGEALTPVRIGLLSSLGINPVAVAKRPQVAILATGNELLEPGQPHQAGKIYSSNHYSLAAQVKKAGGEPVLLGIAPDTKDGLKALIQQGLQYPIFISSGGISVGKYDLVKTILEESGVEIKFWQVAIKPGKPTHFGTYNNNLIFALPGYPVASMLCFEHFIRPVISKMQGADYSAKYTEAFLEQDLKFKPGRMQFLRAHLFSSNGTLFVCPLKGQGSGILSTLAKANCLLIIPPEQTELKAQDKVKVLIMDNHPS